MQDDFISRVRALFASAGAVPAETPTDDQIKEAVNNGLHSINPLSISSGANLVHNLDTTDKDATELPPDAVATLRQSYDNLLAEKEHCHHANMRFHPILEEKLQGIKLSLGIHDEQTDI